MIKQKRQELVDFIHEQLIGPGGCSDRFSLSRHVLENEHGEELPDICEVLNTTPGSIYSSAILFPQRQKNDIETIAERSEEADDSPEESEDVEGGNDEIVQEFSNREDDEDLNSLSRRFPDRIAISCCLENAMNLQSQTTITISGRFYRKVLEKTSLQVKIEDIESFEQIFNLEASKELHQFFVYEKGVIRLNHIFNPKNELPEFKIKLRELNKKFCAIIARNEDGSFDDIYTDKSFQEKNKFLSAYKERLFKKLKSIGPDGKYITKEKCDEYIKRIEVIEQYETFISYFEDAIAICDTRGFGYWAGEYFEKKIDISTLDFSLSNEKSKKVFLFVDSKKQKNENCYDCLTDVIKYTVKDKTFASLSICLQVFKSKDDKIYLKVMLVNTSTPVELDENKYYSIVTEHVNERCFFGVRIEVTSKYILPYRSDKISSIDDVEAQRLRYLYRSIEDFGIGHLCSVGWHRDENGIIHVYSEFMPEVETPDVEAIPRNKAKTIRQDKEILPAPYLIDDECLRFKWLSIFSKDTDNVTNETIVKGLLDFLESYHNWILAQDPQGNSFGNENLQNCLDDYNRMVNNVKEFLTDDVKMLHFRLMNTAMFLQLWHNKNQDKVRKDECPMTIKYYCDQADDKSIFNGVHAAWRPFQLAFILLNLDGIYKSINDPQWKKRNELVDLVWFPTGGGKTESYLGIIALTILKRRMLNPDGRGNGVAAIMRYTLRLLTTQQFQRALRLILALEQIRRWKDQRYYLGDEEISIGLYVGENSLPNHYDDFAKEVREHWDDEGSHGKIPLDVCPWCGSPLRAKDIATDRFKFACSNKHCTYGKRNYLPVRLCDDHIFEAPPSLLFGTVDKFAQIARRIDTKNFKSDSRQIFGIANNVLPPDIIIQDELHLLLGPLGSAVALFEGAVDQLCSYQDENHLTIRPKIISSTATTRNTSFQVRALYDREVSIFPKNGTDYDDSYFAFFKRHKFSSKEDWSFVSKRKYVGIMPTGRTQMTTQMRLAAILFVHRAIFEKEHITELKRHDARFIKAANYYYSIISYFNSLKEVGKTDAQFYLEFTKFTRRLFKRVLRFSDMLECFYAYNEIFTKSELTGRLTGGEAVSELNKVQSISWEPNHRLPYKENVTDESFSYPNVPADYILATNMISVGLDVSRFNTIIMNSMPRNISEYIQASSRVAREQEGLVLTLHNPFRSRDVSHFEKFREFHEKLYYYVDPISITPYSPKAVEKYLPLYMTAIIRQKYLELADRKSASNLTKEIAVKLKKNLKHYFITRYNRTQNLPDELHLEKGILTEGQLNEITKWIDESIDQWLEKAENENNLVYYAAGRNAHDERSLLISPDDYADKKKDSKWVVPSSLRMVEPEAVLHIMKEE